MTKKKTETRPSNTPVAVRFTVDQITEISAVASEFQMSKQDVIRLSVAAGLKAMRNIGIAGLQEFIAFEIKARNHIPNVTEAVADIPIFELPFLGAVAAGEPVSAPLDELCPVPKNYGPGHYIVEINGQSAEPEFMDGDKWVIRAIETGTPKQGIPCIVSDGAGSYLKKWNRKTKAFESINAGFNDVTPGEEAKLQGYPVAKLS